MYLSNADIRKKREILQDINKMTVFDTIIDF